MNADSSSIVGSDGGSLIVTGKLGEIPGHMFRFRDGCALVSKSGLLKGPTVQPVSSFAEVLTG
jgi:hypothetical protein